MPIQGKNLPTCNLAKPLFEDDKGALELPRAASDSSYIIVFCFANQLLRQLSGRSVSCDLAGEQAGCGLKVFFYLSL